MGMIICTKSTFAFIRPHHSTAYIDAAYCYRLSSVICLSVYHSSEPCRNDWMDQDVICVEDSGGPIGRRNHVLDGGPDPPCKGVIIRGKDMCRHAWWLGCELYKNGWTSRFAIWVVDSGWPKEAHVNHICQIVPMCPHGRAHWCNLAYMIIRPSTWRCGLMSKTMWPYVKLLWPLVSFWYSSF